MYPQYERKHLFQYGVICALEKLPRGYPVTLCGGIDDVAERAAKAGYGAIELHIRDPHKYDTGVLSRAAMGHGLAFSAITTGLECVLSGLSLISDDEGIRREAVSKLKGHIALAERIGCPSVVIGVMRGSIPDQGKYAEYEERLTEAVLALSDYAEGKPVDVLIESINRYVTNYLCSVPETLEYIRKLDRPNVKIHIDTHQMNIEDTDLGEAVRACSGKLGYVHLSDSNRKLPGGGNINFIPVMRALYEDYYDGYLGIESEECLPGDPALEECLKMLHDKEHELFDFV
ncbi:MAG: sugar phosphate isomerase/epimerase [Clostridiales bacterium]|nr:sugar phosphate isomerase/epimerase [Clostridiales bacterium]